MLSYSIWMKVPRGGLAHQILILVGFQGAPKKNIYLTKKKVMLGGPSNSKGTVGKVPPLYMASPTLEVLSAAF
jgi:hypothetical protein